jgi:flagellar hook-associated protein 1
MSLFSALGSTASTLAAFEQALTVTQNNVSNASTPGYARQTQTFEALPFEIGTGQMGGVTAGAIESARDEFAEQNVRSTNAQLGQYGQQVEILTNLQSQFDISGNTGIPAALNSLFGAFSTWSVSPNDGTARQNVLSTAQSVAAAFQNTAANVAKLASGADTITSALVERVNALASQLASYNAQIHAGGQNNAALDAAMSSTLESLSEIANVTTIKHGDGSVEVLLGGQTALVDGARQNKLSLHLFVPTAGGAVSGNAVTNPVSITPSSNALNLTVDGQNYNLTLTTANNTSLSAVAADINTQLAAAGSTATASVNTSGSLVITSGSTGSNASVAVRPGSANASLGLIPNNTMQPLAQVLDSSGNDLSSEITGGKLAGALQVRNQVMAAVQGDATQPGALNQLAQAFANRVNTLLGAPLFTYSANANSVAGSLQVNSALTAQQLPSAQVIALTGGVMITSGVNDTLNLNIDGTNLPAITLKSSDKTMAAVASDINTQLKAAGSTATASVDSQGSLVIASGSTGATASVQVLAGSANTTLGLTATASATGSSVSSAITITPASAGPPVVTGNDGLNLNIDGKTWPTITLNPADTTMAAVASDLNTQFGTLGIGAQASVNGQGSLVISSTGSGCNASVQILAGTANTPLGLTQTTPTYKNGANSVALNLADLADSTNSADQINGQTYTAFFGSIAGNIGSQLSTAQTGQSLQTDLLSQAKALRQQVSGVDLNEEATKVLEFQRSYQAASKMMSVVDEMMQTVINLIQPS